MQLIGLNTKILGKKCIYFKEIASTQDEIWKKYQSNIENGMLIIADKQTNGKGTHGRRWYTDEENNIAFSFFVKTNCKADKIEGLTLKIADIIVEIFKQKYNVFLEIKYPNDIVYHGKKIGGILTQSKTLEGKVKCLVIGIGINLVQQEFAQEIKDIATSIKKEFEIEVKREDIITEFLNRFEKVLIEKEIIS